MPWGNYAHAMQLEKPLHPTRKTPYSQFFFFSDSGMCCLFSIYCPFLLYNSRTTLPPNPVPCPMDWPIGILSLKLPHPLPSRWLRPKKEMRKQEAVESSKCLLASSPKKNILICSIGPFLWCKYSTLRDFKLA